MSEKIEVKVTAEGNELILREGNARRIYEYKGFRHEAYSTDSFISLISAKANFDNTVIAYTDSGIEAIVDDQVFDRDQDRINYSFRLSQQFKEWEPILKGTAVDQKTFFKFLQRREPGEITNIDSLMAAVQNIKFAKTTSGEAAFTDNNNYVFAIQVGEVEGTARIPQIIVANIAIYNESGYEQALEIEVEMNLPSRQDEKLTFGLSCPKLARYMREAVENEIDKVKEELDGYLIVTGKI
jgi:hypothetical protein